VEYLLLDLEDFVVPSPPLLEGVGTSFIWDYNLIIIYLFDLGEMLLLLLNSLSFFYSFSFADPFFIVAFISGSISLFVETAEIDLFSS